MVNVAVTTTIPVEIYREIKEKRLSFNGLILAGLRADDKMQNLTERLRDLESYEEDHINTIRELRTRLTKLESGNDEDI